MSPRLVEYDKSSRWISEFNKQVLRGKHLLVYGNVNDQFLWNGSYITARDLVPRYFSARGYSIVLCYDPVDGLRFHEPAMQQRFGELLRKAVAAANPQLLGGDVPSSAPVGQASAPADNPATVHPTEDGRRGGLPHQNTTPHQDTPDLMSPPPRRSPLPAAANPAAPRRLSAFEAFSELRHVLGQGEASVAVLLDLGDMLTGDPARYTEPEREALMQLKKCILGAALVQEGPLAGFRNTIVLMAGELRRVPEWLYLDNPVVSVVHASRPSKEERMTFMRSFMGEFCGGADLPTELHTEVIEDFADHTEGFQAWDLEALRRTSWVEQIPLARLRALVDYYKFGLRDDPWEELNREKVANASAILSKRVIGQPYAVESVVRMLTTARVGISITGSGRSGQPKGVFFFVGPTGVGKTELAKAVTELVFGDERAFARFDMSEYKEEHAAEKLAGAPPGFVGYEEGGQLTNRMHERPHSILLFDEIEKAHPRVLDKFLQILEDGRLTDGKGQTAYFHQAAIIFTSNIGASQLYETARQRGADGASMSFAEVSEFFQEQVRDFFANRIQRAEIYNRLGDNIVPFDMLRPDYVALIGQKFLGMLAGNCAERLGLRLEYQPSVLELLKQRMVESDNLLLGGRRIKTLLETLVQHPLNKWLFENHSDLSALSGKTLRIGLSTDGELEAGLV